MQRVVRCHIFCTPGALGLRPSLLSMALLRGLKRAASVTALDLQKAKQLKVTKSHQAILETALRDIDKIKFASKDPDTELKGAKNLIRAYREHLRKMHDEKGIVRPWASDTIASKVCKFLGL